MADASRQGAGPKLLHVPTSLDLRRNPSSIAPGDEVLKAKTVWPKGRLVGIIIIAIIVVVIVIILLLMIIIMAMIIINIIN